ncbi:MAG: hypothetical protein JNM69_08095 [Archangium sp.]|nr:hypothetical protein [Archangium sp.]
MNHHDSGNDAAALIDLDEYQTRFPAGVMLVEARVLRVLVLCQLERKAEATSLLRELERTTPASPALQRLSSSCVVR